MIASVSPASDQAWWAKRASAAGSSSPITYETTTRSAWVVGAADVGHRPPRLLQRRRPVRGKRLAGAHHLGLCLDEVTTDEIPGQASTAAQAAMPGPAPRSRTEDGDQPGRASPIWRKTSAAAAKVAGARVAR